MEIALSVGQILYRDGYLKEALSAMRTSLRLATVYDRLDVWVKVRDLCMRNLCLCQY
jgi:hypothetical protein